MLTVKQIIDKTYTPRDLWETIERVTQLEAAIQAHKWHKEAIASDADKRLWEILEKTLYSQ